MNNTYEFDGKEKLERWEWDDIWWESNNDTTTPRVWYIGDSISVQCRRVVTRLADGAFLVDGYGSSKGVDNSHLIESLNLFASQALHREVILVNFGHHGGHLEDKKEFVEHFDRVLTTLEETYKEAKFALVLTTFSANNPNWNERIKVRNKGIIELGKKHNLPVIDLFSVTDGRIDLMQPDKVHLNEKGNEIIATEIVKTCKELLK